MVENFAKTQFTFFWNSEYAVLTSLKIGTRYLEANRAALPNATNFTVSLAGSGLLTELKKGCNLNHQVEFYRRRCGGSFLDFVSRFKKLYILIREPEQRAITGLIQAINRYINNPDDLVVNSPYTYLQEVDERVSRLPLEILGNEHLDAYHIYVDRFIDVCPCEFEIVDLPHFDLFPDTDKRTNGIFLGTLENNDSFLELLKAKSFLIQVEQLYYSKLKQLSKNVPLSRKRSEGL